MMKFTLFAHSWKNVQQWHRWIDSHNSFLGAKIVNNQPDSFLGNTKHKGQTIGICPPCLHSATVQCDGKQNGLPMFTWYLSYRSSDSLTSSLKGGGSGQLKKELAGWVYKAERCSIHKWKAQSHLDLFYISYAWHVDNVLGGFTWVKEKLESLYASVMMKSYKLKDVTS